MSKIAWIILPLAAASLIGCSNTTTPKPTDKSRILELVRLSSVNPDSHEIVSFVEVGNGEIEMLDEDTSRWSTTSDLPPFDHKGTLYLVEVRGKHILGADVVTSECYFVVTNPYNYISGPYDEGTVRIKKAR